MSDTNIPVSDEVWSELNQRKQRGDTFDDVLRRVLGMRYKQSEKSDEPKASIHPGEIEDVDPAILLPDDLPQTVNENDARDAIQCAVKVVKERNGATMREIVNECLGEHSLGYEVVELDSGDRYRGAWWRRVVKPGLEQHESITKPPRGASEWRWTGQE